MKKINQKANPFQICFFLNQTFVNNNTACKFYPGNKTILTKETEKLNRKLMSNNNFVSEKLTDTQYRNITQRT